MPERLTADDGESDEVNLRAAEATATRMAEYQSRLVQGIHPPGGAAGAPALGKEELDTLTLEEAVIAAFSLLKTQGNEDPSEVQCIRLKHLAFVLSGHRALRRITHGTPGLPADRRRRRRHDALKRAIKAIPEIRRKGSTKDSYYVYNSAAPASHAILSAVLEQIIRDPPMSIDDIIMKMDMMDGDTLIDSLHTLEDESALEFDEYHWELKPGIWEVSPGGKRTLTITLPEHTLNLFDELTARFTDVQESINEHGGFQDPVAGGSTTKSGIDYDLLSWQRDFDDIPFPMVPMSKSMIVEIALWNLWKEYVGRRTSHIPLDASSEGLDKRSNRIERTADVDEFNSLVSRLKTIEEKLARL